MRPEVNTIAQGLRLKRRILFISLQVVRDPMFLRALTALPKLETFVREVNFHRNER